MNEFELIAHLTRSLPGNASVIVGPGDDCAVLDSGQPGRYLLLKTDAVVQGIHFSTTAEPEQIGHKAMGRCLSDIAAMAGRPIASLITIALPSQFDPAFLQRIYAGMNRLAEQHGVAIVGGETTANPGGLLISVCLLGDVASDKCILRSGAKSGDALFVTGELGGSLAARHLEFEPRLAEARWLAEHFTVHAMIDISDGLAGDLRHLLQRSNVGAEVLAQAIPISRAARLQAKAESSARTPLLAALSDGEDFELLFTLESRDAVPLLDAWKKQFPKVRLSCIGKITSAPGLKLRDKTGVRSSKPMATFISHNPAQTEALGEEWGRQAQSGWLIGLSGALGSGKTQLAGGLARGLGAGTRAPSPTFALVNEYLGGRLPLFHLDLYRLSTREQIIAAGLEHYLVRPRGVAVVEWIERWLGDDGIPAGGKYRRVLIKTIGETEREIFYDDFGG